MSRLIPHPCAVAGCSTLVTRGARCRQHAALITDDRLSAQQRGYTKAWARYSRERLAQYPYCSDPDRRHRVRVRATVTDHIIPASVAPQLFWNEANHRSLCASCNARHATRARTTRTGVGGRGR